MSRFFCYYSYTGGFWFRILGYGLSFENRSVPPLPMSRPLFSERNGYIRAFHVCGWSIRPLARPRGWF
jgi:hypothetical protein